MPGCSHSRSNSNIVISSAFWTPCRTAKSITPLHCYDDRERTITRVPDACSCTPPDSHTPPCPAPTSRSRTSYSHRTLISIADHTSRKRGGEQGEREDVLRSRFGFLELLQHTAVLRPCRSINSRNCPDAIFIISTREKVRREKVGTDGRLPPSRARRFVSSKGRTRTSSRTPSRPVHPRRTHQCLECADGRREKGRTMREYRSLEMSRTLTFLFSTRDLRWSRASGPYG